MPHVRERFTTDDLVTLNRAAMIPRLLAGVTHEINNALLIVGGTAEMLEGAAVPEEVTKGAARIRLQTGRIGQALRALLDFARGDPSSGSRIRLQETAASAVALRAHDIRRAGLTISVLPEAPGCVTKGNGVLLQQAVLNLIFNAEQALAGRRGGAITVTLHQQAGYADVRVADNGPGVPADQRAHIFGAFVGTDAPRQGSGLGLAATRRIAEVHGGTLILEDSTAGAAFVLRLPLEEIGTDDA